MSGTAPENAQAQTLKKNVTVAAALVMVMNLVAKVLGFLREMVIARVYGATMFTDAYLVAYSLPSAAQQVIGWAIVAAVVPLLTKRIVEGEAGAIRETANTFLNSTALLMLLISAVGIIASPLLIKLTAPSLDAETTALAVDMMRILFPVVLFYCIGMVLTGILHAHRRFAIAAFAPAFSSIIVIFAVLLCGHAFGIWGLVLGTLVSFVGFALIQVPSAHAAGWRWSLVLPKKNEEINMALVNLVPIILGMSVNQIYYMLNRFFASGLAEGSISALNYGSKLAQFPAGVFVSAIAVAIYPLLTEYAVRGDKENFHRALDKGLGVVLLLTVPAAIGLVVLRIPVVRILFEYGAFTPSDTLASASALMFYAIGTVAYSLIMVLLRVFFAFSDIKTPVIAGLCGITVNIVISLLLVNTMEHDGLALATTLGSTANMLVFFAFLPKHLPDMSVRPLLLSVVKISVAALLMGAVVKVVMLWMGGLGDLAVIVVGLLVGIFVYLGLVVAFRTREIGWVKDMVKKKLGR
ncbi:MAG: murein biosynthesis integral membrane protein MurJ [Firmicutes bacterium]|nr:murein biosynthesis integral membrane protein MurJ [Bacillota bacterium]